MVTGGKRQLDDDPLVRQIFALRSAESYKELKNPSEVLQSILRQCLERCRRFEANRQDLDNLGLWISTARSLVPTHTDDLAKVLLSDDMQGELTHFIWDRLDSDKSSISKKAETVTQLILSLVDTVINFDPSGASEAGSSASRREISPLAANLLRRAKADFHTRTSLVAYDILFTVYDASVILGTSERMKELYSQLVVEFPAKGDIPSRRSRVCMRILRSKAQGWGITFRPTDESVEERRNDRWADWYSFACEPVVRALSSFDKYSRASTSVYHLAELFELAPVTVLHILQGLLRKLSPEDSLLPVLATLRAAKSHSLARVSKIPCVLGPGEIALGQGLLAPDSNAPHSFRELRPYDRPCIVVPVEMLSACATSTDEELQVSAVSLVVESRGVATPFSEGDFFVFGAYLESSFSTTHPSGRGAMHSLFGKLLARLAAATYAADRELTKPPKKQGKKGATEAQTSDSSIDRLSYTKLIEMNKSFVLSIVQLAVQALHPGAPYHIVIAALTFLELLLLAGVDPSFHRQGGGPISFTFGKFSNTPSMGLHIIDSKLVRTLLDCADSTYEDVQARALGLLQRFPAPLAGLPDASSVEHSLLSKIRRLILSGRDCECTAAGHLLRVYQQIYVRTLGWQPASLGAIPAGTSTGVQLSQSEAQSGDLCMLRDLRLFLETQIAFAEHNGLFAAAKTRPLHGSLLALQKMLQDAFLWSSDFQAGAARMEVLKIQGLIDRVWALTRPILCAAAPEGSANEEGDDTADTEVARALAAVEGGGSAVNADTLIRKSQIMLSYSWRGMKEAAALLGVLISAPLRYQGTEGSSLWSVQELNAVGQRFTTYMTEIRHRGAFSTVYPAFSDAAAAIVRRADWPEAQILPTRWLRDFVAMITGREKTISITRRSAGVGYAVLALLTAMPLKSDRTSLDETITGLMLAADECLEKGNADENQSIVAAHIHAINIIRVLVLDSNLAEYMYPYTDALLSLSIRRFQSRTWYIRNAGLMLFSALSPRAFPARKTNEDDLSTQLPANRFFQMYPTLYDALKSHLSASISQKLHKAQTGGEAEQAGSLFAVLFLLSRTQAVEHEEGFTPDLLTLRVLVEQCLGSTDYKMREIASRAHSSLTTDSQAYDTVRALLMSLSSSGEGLEENYLHGVLLAVVRLTESRSLQERAGAGASELETLLRTLKNRVQYASLDVQDAYSRVVSSSSALTDRNEASPSSRLDSLRRQIFDDTLDFQHRAEAADQLYEEDCSEYYGVHDAALESDWDQVASLAVGSGCVPLREAAVALLGRLTRYVSVSAADFAKRLALLSRIVRTCAQETQHVESRLAAVRALRALCGSSLLFSHQTKPKVLGTRAEVWQHSLFTLHISAINLIQDDDEEVRLLAAEIVAETIGRASITSSRSSIASTHADASEDPIRDSFIRAAKSTVASSNTSATRAWTWMSTYYGVDARGDTEMQWWGRWLMRMVLPPERGLSNTLPPVTLHNPSATDDAPPSIAESQDLFAAERPNLYRDYEVDVKRAYQILKEHCPSVSEKFRQREASYAVRLEQWSGNLNAAELFKSVEARLLGVRLVCAADLAGDESPARHQVQEALGLFL